MGNSSFLSYSLASSGVNSFSANSRTAMRISSCSSVSSKFKYKSLVLFGLFGFKYFSGGLGCGWFGGCDSCVGSSAGDGVGCGAGVSFASMVCVGDWGL